MENFNIMTDGFSKLGLVPKVFRMARAVVIALLCVLQGFLVVAQDSSTTSSSIKFEEKPLSSGKKPNFVVLLVDDLGIADLGCFGNDTIKTPNIDRLASMGVKLNHNLAPESICTPSRAATLTGRYAIRSGMGAGPNAIRVPVNLGTSGGLPNNETTFSSILQQNGYKTSLIGKWHLGLNCKDRDDNCHHPLNMGFDKFYGLPLTNLRDCGPRRDESVVTKAVHRVYVFPFVIVLVTFILALALTGFLSKKSALIFVIIAVLGYYAAPTVEIMVFSKFTCILMRGFNVVEQPVILDNLTVKFTNEAKHFIHENNEKPFLLFMSYVKVHTALFSSPAFKGHSVHGSYGDNVEEVDWSVGEIVAALEESNILDNTFVYFTSDHGPHLEEVMQSGEYCGGWKGQYRGGKSQSWEGGIRVPTLAMWKKHISAGIEIDEPTNTMDIFTTMVELAGASIPTDRAIDGKNIFPLLTKEQTISPHEFMFHYCGTAIHAVRYRPRSGKVTWKAHFVTPKWAPGKEECPATIICGCFGKDVEEQNPPLLYDITNDPYERHQLDTSTEVYQDIINKMKDAIKKHKLGVKSVPNQLGYPNAWWNPHRQPCCNFPYCSCSES